MRGVHAEHIAFPGPAQHHLDLANPVDAVRRHPGEGHAGVDRPLDHRPRELGLGGEGHAFRHVRGRPARRIVGPSLWQIERPVDEGMALRQHIGREHADLAVGDLAR